MAKKNTKKTQAAALRKRAEVLDRQLTKAYDNVDAIVERLQVAVDSLDTAGYAAVDELYQLANRLEEQD